MFERQSNAGAWFVDRHMDGPRRDHVAFIEAGGAGRRLTYGELAERAGRMGGLLAQAGVERENRVALLMTDTADLPVAFWGAIKAGIVPVPLNTMLSGELYRTILADCRARALFVSPELLPVVAPFLSELPELRKTFVIGPEFEAALESAEARETVAVSPDECAFWLY